MTGAARLVTAAAMRAGAGYVRLSTPGGRCPTPVCRPRSSPARCPRVVGRRSSEGPRPVPGARRRARAGSRRRHDRGGARAGRGGRRCRSVVDGDGLFALAWSADGAAAVLQRRPAADRAHAPRRRVRPAGRARARAPTASPRLGSWRRRPVRSCCSRVRRPSWPSRVVGSSSRPPVTSGWPRPARGTCCPASSVRSLAQQVPAFEAAAAGAWLHGSAGRQRSGAGSGRLRPARAAARCAGAPVIAVADPRRGAWVEVDLGAIAANVGVLAETVAAGRAVGRSSRPTATATAPPRWPGRRSRPAPRGCAWPSSRRARRSGRPASWPRSSCCPSSRSRSSTSWSAGASRRPRTRPSYLEALAQEARETASPTVRVHLKVDTGMHRVGARPDADGAAGPGAAGPSRAALGGAVDAPGPRRRAGRSRPPSLQLGLLDDVVLRAGARPATRRRSSTPPTRPAGWPGVRRPVATWCGPASPSTASLRARAWPGCAASWSRRSRCGARVSHVQRVAAGEGVSYGHRTVLDRDRTIATLPLGYADGVPRRLSDGRAARC